MSCSLVVAGGLTPLADLLADELARPLPDPFVREVVAVPGDGVRTWLASRLAARLGIVANVDFVFPGQLIRRAIGDEGRSWSIGQMTWAVYETMCRQGEQLGMQADAVRARAIADLFDRYAIHRSEMVRRWEVGVDVDATGAPVPSHLRWQPALWRHVREVLGVPSDATLTARAVDELRAGRREPDLPQRVFLVGLTSLPAQQLDVLTALAARRDVRVLSPTPSVDMWARLRDALPDELPSPCPRPADPTASTPRHRLIATWGRPAREAHLVLLDAARRAHAEVRLAEPPAPTIAPTSLLAHLQHELAADLEPPGPSAEGAFDFRFPLRPDDRSVQWHRCHGLGRQVEVLRDVIAHLLELPAAPGEAPLEPRDIAILCADVAAAAPLAEATFAGDPERGVPALPLRVADRSLRQDNPLLDAVGALLELLDGRFRASSVLAFAGRAPVRRRFGLPPDQLGQLATWAEQLHVRWGLDPSARARFGVPPEIRAHTWQAGLDQLLLGAMMADDGDRLGVGRTPPFGDIEGDAVELAGTLAELVHRLGEAHAQLTVDQPVAAWCDAVRRAMQHLCAVSDADSWQWRDLERELTAMADDAQLPGGAAQRAVPAGDLAALLSARLVGRPGRVRFGTGAITMSSLTAQRGVPYRVVCLLGIDGDHGGNALSGDDLTLVPPCVGDRDARSETRAQLLDAVLAARDRLIVFSSGHDVRSNAEVPPAVPLAELADLLDVTALPMWSRPERPVRASSAVAVDHPRQSWSEANFLPAALGVDGPLSFDRGARDAAEQRRRQQRRHELLDRPLPADVPAAGAERIELEDLVTTLGNPVRTLLHQRLGLWLESGSDARDDLVPLRLESLDAWRLKHRLIGVRLAEGGEWDQLDAMRWGAVQQAAGAVPPLSFGAAAVIAADGEVAKLFVAARSAVGAALDRPASMVPIDVSVGARRVVGEISGVRGNVALEITPTTLKPKHTLAAWLRLAALTCAHPEVPWQVALVGRRGSGPLVVHLTMVSPTAARDVLDLALDLHDRARSTTVPALAATTHALHTAGRNAAAKTWAGRPEYDDASDVWVRFALGQTDLDDVLAIGPLPDECGSAWGAAPSRIERWAHRIWSMFASTASVVGPDGVPVDVGDEAAGVNVEDET